MGVPAIAAAACAVAMWIGPPDPYIQLFGAAGMFGFGTISYIGGVMMARQR